MDTFQQEMIKQDRERLHKAVEFYEKLMDLEWDVEKLEVVMGWRCPNCGKGLAPHVTVCPCTDVITGFDVDGMKGAFPQYPVEDVPLEA